MKRFRSYLEQVGEMVVHLFAKGEDVGAIFQLLNWAVLILFGATFVALSNDAVKFAAFTWLAFVVFVYAPYLVWTKEAKRADEAEALVRPGLKCTFDKEKDCQHRTKIKWKHPMTRKTLKSLRIRLFRIRVESVGVNAIKDCAAHLLSLTRDGRVLFDHDSLPLTFAPAERPDPYTVEIRHKNREHADLFGITEDNKVFIYPLGRPFPISIAPDTLFTGPGEYRFRVLVSASGCPSEEITAVLKWTGDWETAEAYGA